MALYDQICEQAIGNYGLITTMDAESLGVRRKDLVEWVKLGRLTRLGHGVYRIEHYLPTEYDRYAEAVAIVGKDAALWDESVLAMHNLAMVNPLRVQIVAGDGWRKTYEDAYATIADASSLLRSVDDAVAWANELVSRIDEVGRETRGMDDKPSRIGNLGECEG